MLTADLIDVRKKDGELFTRALDAKRRAEALELASNFLEAARAHEGQRREELMATWDAIATGASKPKLAGALRKLVEDGCVFEAEPTTPPPTLRRALFVRASEVRRTLEPGERFDRASVVADVARSLDMAPEEFERALFSDLRSEHLLRESAKLTPESVVEAYELGQAQAILLKAVRVTCEVRSAAPGPLRAFFGKLKFHKLLFSAERTGERGFRVVIDGPFSMFDAVTRYGLRLALLVPALRALDDWSLVADVRWGQSRESLVFRMESEAPKAPKAAVQAERRLGRTGRAAKANAVDDAHANPVDDANADADDDDVHLDDEVRSLLEGLRKAKTGYRASAATTLLDVPGLGVCVPDLVLRPKAGGPPIYVEVLGFWSRDAVFRRIELSERGLGARVVFAVSARLRVSEELLDETPSASLYVYKGKMSARAVLEHVERVALSSAGSSAGSSA